MVFFKQTNLCFLLCLVESFAMSRTVRDTLVTVLMIQCFDAVCLEQEFVYIETPR